MSIISPATARTTARTAVKFVRRASGLVVLSFGALRQVVVATAASMSAVDTDIDAYNPTVHGEIHDAFEPVVCLPGDTLAVKSEAQELADEVWAELSSDSMALVGIVAQLPGLAAQFVVHSARVTLGVFKMGLLMTQCQMHVVRNPDPVTVAKVPKSFLIVFGDIPIQ